MANYDDFKKKAKDAIDTIADVSIEAYKMAEEKAKIFAKRAKLTAEITRERTIVRRSHISIGTTYYELHKDAPEEALKQNCEDITNALDRIAAMQRQLEDLKNRSCSCDSCDEDAEDAEPESKEDDAK